MQMQMRDKFATLLRMKLVILCQRWSKGGILSRIEFWQHMLSLVSQNGVHLFFVFRTKVKWVSITFLASCSIAVTMSSMLLEHISITSFKVYLDFLMQEFSSSCTASFPSLPISDNRLFQCYLTCSSCSTIQHQPSVCLISCIFWYWHLLHSILNNVLIYIIYY